MSRGKCLTAKITECRKPDAGCTLSDIIEKNVQEKYYLSHKQVGTLLYSSKEAVRELYSSDGVGVTLTSGTGGFGGKTGIYLIEDFGLRIKVKTKKGFQIAQPGDTIDTAYATINSRRGRVGYEIAHTLTTSATQAYYFVDLNTDPQLTEIARCITARYNAGIGRRKAERSGIFLEEIDENAPFAVLIVDRNGEYHVGRIRRLTPRECWRLQGFTDEQFDKALAAGISDNQLYKMAGNAVSVPVITAIGRVIKEVEERNS